MGVLHVVHRVVVVLGHRQVHIKGVLGVGFAAEQEEAHRVLAGPLNQVAQRDIAASALGNLDFLPALDHPYHGVQHIVRVALGNADVRRLQPGAHPGDGAMVVGALDIDHLLETALPFGDVVRHIRHKVGVAAVALAHHPVLVVAISGGLEPQRAVLFVGLAGLLQFLHCRINPATQVQAAFQVIVVKAHRKGLEVQVLLVAQVGHGKQPDVVQRLDIARGGEAAVVRLHRLAGQKVGGYVGDVLAVVGLLGPLRVAGLEALGPQLGAGGQGADLHARVVVIELAVHRPALRLVQVADGIPQRRLAAVAHVQRTGRVGRHKFHQQALAVRGLGAKLGTLRQHVPHHRLFGRGMQPDVDKARPSNVQRRHPALKRRCAQQLGAQRVGQLARVGLEGFGQLHGGGGGQVAMGGHLG